MKSTVALALTIGLIGSVAANPRIVRYGTSTGSAFARRAEGDSTIALRSISNDPVSFASSSYDYIIVGGGTAGLALAARLSQSGHHTVGILEAGIIGLDVPIIDIPGYTGADLNTIYDCE